MDHLVVGMCSYPYCCDPADVLYSQLQMQERFFYYVDTMVRGKYPTWAKRDWRAHGIVDFSYSDRDKAVLAAHTPDFLAFSYYSSAVETTHELGGG